MQTVVQLYHAVDRSRFALAPPDNSYYHGTARAEHRRCGAVTTLNIDNENGYHFHARYKHVGINTVPAVDRKKSVHRLLRIQQVIRFVTAETRSAARGLGGIANDSQ